MDSFTTLEQFEAEATRFTKSLAPRKDRATLVTLSGPLGAGKTAFVKAAARTLGVDDVVTSPTFVLEKVYRLPDRHPFARLAHVDAYRLESGKELAPLGFDELMRDSGTLVLFEWPEKVADALPEPAARVTINVDGAGTRTISYG